MSHANTAFDRISSHVRSLFEHFPNPAFAGDEASATTLAEVHRRQLVVLLEKMGLSEMAFAGKTVLDVGCGTGTRTIAVARSGAGRVVGLDFSSASLRQAAFLKAHLGMKNVHFVQASLYDCDALFARTQFDVVLSWGVVHHTAAPHEAFRQLAARVRPGGLLMLSGFNLWGCLSNGLVLRQWLVKTLAGQSIRRRVELATKLYYRGKEKAFIDSQDRDVATYMADVYANHHRFHSFGQLHRWITKEGLCFRASYPSLIFSEYADQMISRAPETWRGRLARRVLCEAWYHQVPPLCHYSVLSRAMVALFTFLGRYPGVHLVAEKRRL